MLRTLGDLSAAAVRERVLDALDSDAMLAELVRERRAVVVRVAREERYIAAQDAGLYRDALGVMPPSGLPDAFLADVPDALRELAARHARANGPFPTAELSARYGVDMSSPLRELCWSAASCARPPIRGPAQASANGAIRRSCVACAARRSPCCAAR